jgi:hypothetical protein
VKHSPRAVLVLAGRLHGGSHDPHCEWVEGIDLEYVPADADALPAKISRCSWGGGRSGFAHAEEVVLAMDASAHLSTLVGTTIHTIGQGRPNRIVAVDGASVVVATHQSPNGQRIAIAEVQAAMDMLEQTGDLLIDKKLVGYLSAFIGAVLARLPGAIVSTRPRRVRLERR